MNEFAYKVVLDDAGLWRSIDFYNDYPNIDTSRIERDLSHASTVAHSLSVLHPDNRYLVVNGYNEIQDRYVEGRSY